MLIRSHDGRKNVCLRLSSHAFTTSENVGLLRARRALYLVHGRRPANVGRIFFRQLRLIRLLLLLCHRLPEQPRLLHVRGRLIDALLQGGLLRHQCQLLLLFSLLQIALVMLNRVLFLVGVGDERMVYVQVQRLLLDELVVHVILGCVLLGGLGHFTALCRA